MFVHTSIPERIRSVNFEPMFEPLLNFHFACSTSLSTSVIVEENAELVFPRDGSGLLVDNSLKRFKASATSGSLSLMVLYTK
jgi:hypothetical protein